jgi:hypothetical protein
MPEPRERDRVGGVAGEASRFVFRVTMGNERFLAETGLFFLSRKLAMALPIPGSLRLQWRLYSLNDPISCLPLLAKMHIDALDEKC